MAVGQMIYPKLLWFWLAVICKAANQNYSSFNCFNNPGAPPDYVCEGVNDVTSGLDPALVGIFYCDTPFLTFPDPRHCSSLCGLASTTTGALCNSCGVMESGSLAYDCTNLYPDAECNEKDRDGNCGEEFVNWVCFPVGFGFACEGHSVEDGVARNPAFPFDVVPDSRLLLFCANDIGGKTPKDCLQPLCEIADQTNSAVCSSCRLLDDGTFSYHCVAQIPYMNCGILDENGECQSESKTLPPTQSPTTQGTTFKESESGGDRWSYTFEDTNPTVFLVIYTVFAYICRFLVGLAINDFHPTIMSMQLRRGGTIPLNQLAVVPGNFPKAVKQAWTLRFSAAGMVSVVLLALADSSGTISFTGLEVITTTQGGASQPVLDTSLENRNPNRLMRTMGDPMYQRTVIFPKVFYGNNFSSGNSFDFDAASALRAIERNFMNAVKLIVDGGSPFVTNVVGLTRDVEMGNVSGFVGTYNDDGGPLSTLEKQIPLDCGGNNASASMISYEEVTGGSSIWEEPLESTASVPRCSLTGLRSSGIHNEHHGEPATVLETAAYVGINSAITFASAEGNGIDHPVFLYSGNQMFQKLELTPEDKKLARDRPNWKEGRRVSGIDGIAIGSGTDNITFIELGAIVLASGQQIADRVTQVARNQYALVGEIVGKCPLRPSKLPLTENIQCLTLIELDCDAFPEDFALAVHPVYLPANEENSPCDLRAVNFAYGTGFKADAELVTVVAGLYGVTAPNSYDQPATIFLQNAVLAALFAMGTLRDNQSTEEVFGVDVNLVFILFALLNLVLSVILVIITRLTRHWLLPVPSSPWEITLLAKKCPYIPSWDGQSYPTVDDTLVVALVDARQDEDEHEEDEMPEDDEVPAASFVVKIIRVSPEHGGGEAGQSGSAPRSEDEEARMMESARNWNENASEEAKMEESASEAEIYSGRSQNESTLELVEMTASANGVWNENTAEQDNIDEPTENPNPKSVGLGQDSFPPDGKGENINDSDGNEDVKNSDEGEDSSPGKRENINDDCKSDKGESMNPSDEGEGLNAKDEGIDRDAEGSNSSGGDGREPNHG